MYDSIAFSISAGIIVLFSGMCEKNDASTIHVAGRCAERKGVQLSEFDDVRWGGYCIVSATRCDVWTG